MKRKRKAVKHKTPKRGLRATPKRKAKPRSSASSHPAIFPRSASANRPANWAPGEDYRARIEQPSWPADRIKIGKRHRKDLGNVKALAADINERGLLHPIVVDLKHNLIAGERRLAAWKISNFRDHAVPIHLVPLQDIVAGEWAENDPALRKDFSPSEAVAIKQAIEAELKPAARERMKEGGRSKQKTAPAEKIHSGERASAFTGKSRRTIEKAEQIVAAAETEPEKYGALVRDMDRSGRVDGPFKRLQTMKAAEEIRKDPPPLPGRGPYRGCVIDFPWAAEPDVEDAERLARGYYPYPTMSQAQIVAYAHGEIAPILHADCVIALWIPNFHLARGDHVAVIDALGANPVTVRTWVKDRLGRGQVLRGQTEHAIIASRGKPTLQVGNIATFFHAAADKRQHSLKPQKFYDDFARLVAAPRYASLFETVDRGKNWDGHGDIVEANKQPAGGRGGKKPEQQTLPLVGGAGEEDQASATRRQLRDEFPDGLKGHVITHTVDFGEGMPGSGESVATCTCGVVYRAARYLPMSGHDELDKHILAHWRAMASPAFKIAREAAE